jgi:cell division protein FtsW
LQGKRKTGIRKMVKDRNLSKKGDKVLFFLPLALSIFGLLAIFDASSVSALRDFKDSFHYVKNQLVWLVLGFGSFLICSRIDLKLLKKFALPFFVFNLFLLVLVLIPGIGREVYGGRRWLPIGSWGFQPAELAKLSIIIYLSRLFEKRKEFLPFATVVGIVLILLMLEPDLGTAVVTVATAFCLYFVSGASWKHLGIFAGAASIIGPLLILLSPYRKARLLTFLNSSFDAEGASYHVRQVLIALGAGGLFGRGFGQSRQKFLFLPEVTTDSIFAIVAEELGFLGASLLILILGFLVYRGLRLVAKLDDPFEQMLTVGNVSCVGVQMLVNLGAMVALVPLTGVPLPFISYGGSSLLICLTGMGIVYNISKNC